MLTDIFSKEVQGLYKTPVVQQTAFWSQVKMKLGFSALAVNFKSRHSDLFRTADDSYIHSDVLIILQQIDRNHTIAYVPYGPELEPVEEYQGVFLEELSECLKSYLPVNCIMIRYDLNWESYWAKDPNHFDEQQHWLGPPEKKTQELRFNINTQHWNFRKAGTNILPSNTIYIDLTKDSHLLLESMKSKTRYNIGLASRKGVTVRCIGLDQLDVWYKLYEDTARRNGIHLNDIKYFSAMLTTQARQSTSPAEVMLLVAERDNQPLAAMFLVISDKRASYLYGASSSENRNLMGTYALQWEAISIAKSRGCTEYDMFGVAPNPSPSHPLYGLYKFKTGFGGHLYHSIGCWDYPLDLEKYSYYSSIELSGKGYHIN